MAWRFGLSPHTGNPGVHCGSHARLGSIRAPRGTTARSILAAVYHHDCFQSGCSAAVRCWLAARWEPCVHAPTPPLNLLVDHLAAECHQRRFEVQN